MNPDSIPMTDTAEFMLLYESAQKTVDQYVASVVTVLGFIVLAFGWVATSKEARSMLAHARVYRTAVVLALAMGLLHTLASLWFSARAAGKVRALSSVANHGWLPLDDLKIGAGVLALNLGFVWILYLGLLALVHHVHSTPPREPAESGPSPGGTSVQA